MIHWQPGYIYPPVFYPPHYPLGLRSAFVYVLVALAVGALALRRPANGLAALIALTPFAYAHYIGGTSLTLGKAAFVGFILGLVAHRPSPGVLRDPRVLRIVIALCAVIGAMVLSGLAAEHRDAVVREVGKWVEYGLLFVAGVIAFSNDPDDRPIWATIAGVTALVAVLALAQEFIGAPAGVFLHGVAYPRIAGPLEGPNQLAGWLGIAIPLLLARVLGHRDGRLVAVLAFAAVVDVLSLSRSGIVAAVVGCAVVVAVSKPPRAVGLRFAGGALTVGAIIVVLGTAVGIESRFFSLAEVPQPDHLGTRAELWKAAIDLWRTSPIVGVGAGNYELELGKVGLPDVRTHANSIYLQSLAETGIIGLVAMLGLVYISIETFARSLVRRPLVIGVLGASVALALHQIFDDMVFFPKVGELWWLVLAIGVVEVVNSRDDARPLEEGT